MEEKNKTVKGFCKDCKSSFTKKNIYGTKLFFCRRQGIKRIPDPVTGKINLLDYPECKFERFSGSCGKTGKFFKKKWWKI